MEPIKIGENEKEVLTFLAKNKGSFTTSRIKDTLNKDHIAYVSRSINSLIKKGLIIKSGARKQDGQGRPAQSYKITISGVARYLHETKDFEAVRTQQHLAFYLTDFCKLYDVFDGFSGREELLTSMVIDYNKLESMGYDYEEVLTMGSALAAKKYKKIPSKYRKKLQKWAQTMQPKLGKEYKKLHST